MDAFYELLEEQANNLINTVDDSVPDHRFSLGYKLKKRALLKAYERSGDSAETFERSYNKVRLNQQIAIAVLAALTALLMTGAAVYFVRMVTGLRANEYTDHSEIFALDSDAPEIIETKYRITYDLSGWEETVLNDDELTYWVQYENGEDSIDFRYFPKIIYNNFRLNTEYSGLETVTICGKEAMYYVTQLNTKSLVWDNGDYIFQLDFTVTMEEAEKIIASISKM